MSQRTSYVEENRDRFLAELFDFLRIPSISTDPTRRDDVRRAAEWLAQQFRSLGLETRIDETPGHPIVRATYEAGPDRPTVLVYGHYDVQPADPLDEWLSPPFEPVIVEGNIVARGATDDKGQSFVHLKALETLLRQNRSVPINITFLFEGEEEIGSPNLLPYIEAHAGDLKADVALVSDTAMYAPDVPSLTYGLRGLAYFEVQVQGPDRDLHSGQFGGAVDNPVLVLSRMLAALHDDEGRVAVPGFYDAVVDLDEAERREFAALPFDEVAFSRSIGIPAPAGEPGYTLLERLWARPTIDANGIWGGFAGEGAKTIIPARAGAKISARLVPDQDPDVVAEQVEAYLRALCPPTVRMSFRTFHGGKPCLVPRDHPAMAAARRAIERGFGAPPALIREGGSIPVVQAFQDLLGISTVLMGFGLPDDRAHAPNEKFAVENFLRGIDTTVALYEELAVLKGE